MADRLRQFKKPPIITKLDVTEINIALNYLYEMQKKTTLQQDDESDENYITRP